MNSLDSTFKSYFPFLQNDMFTVTSSIILILYTVLVVPNMPENISMIFDNIIIKFLLFVLIAYISRFNPTLALVITIAVLVSLMRMYQFKEIKNTMANVQYMGYPIEEPNIPPQYKIRDKNADMDNYDEIKEMDRKREKNLYTIGMDHRHSEESHHNHRHSEEPHHNRGHHGEQHHMTDQMPFVGCNGKDGNYMEGVQDFDESESKYADYTNDD